MFHKLVHRSKLHYLMFHKLVHRSKLHYLQYKESLVRESWEEFLIANPQKVHLESRVH